MLDFVIKAWDENQEKLREAFREIVAFTGDLYATGVRPEYDDIMRLIVHFVLNGGDGRDGEWDEGRIHKIDDGEYQGTLIFLVPRKTYQPEGSDYLVAAVGYGSCSSCDALQSVYYMEGAPERKVNDYMTLCLHMIQSFKRLYDEEGMGW